LSATTATTTVSLCSSQKVDCRSSMCCEDSGFTCYEKNAWWAECKPSCTPGIDPSDEPEFQTPWTCAALSSSASTPTVTSEATAMTTRGATSTTISALLCSSDKEDCRASMCCKDPASQCYARDEFWAECMPSCIPGIGSNDPEHYLHFPWSCELLNVGSGRRLQQEFGRDSAYTSAGVSVGLVVGVVIGASFVSLSVYNKFRQDAARRGLVKIHPESEDSDDLLQ